MNRRWKRVTAVFFALALIAWTTGVAWAADEAHKGGEKPNILSPRFDLGIWTIVVFALLLLVLRKYAWGPMLQGLTQREETIRAALSEAQKANEEAKRLRDQVQAELNRAQEKVRDILDQGRRDAQRTTDEMLAKARADIQTERERLHREIDLARDQALQELWNQSAQLATLISVKAIRRQLTPDDHRRFVDEAIADLRQAANERQREVAGVYS